MDKKILLTLGGTCPTPSDLGGLDGQGRGGIGKWTCERRDIPINGGAFVNNRDKSIRPGEKKSLVQLSSISP